MTRILKAIALLGAVLVALGVLLSVIGFAFGGSRYLARSRSGFNWFGWSLTGGTGGPVVENSAELSAFRSIRVTGNYLELEMRPSGDDAYRVESAISSDFDAPDCRVNDGTLEIHSKWPDGWNKHGNRTYRVTVYYPGTTAFDSLSVHLNAGVISLENARAAVTGIDVSAAAINISNAALGQFSLHNAAGNVQISDSTAEEASLSLNMGNLEADSFDTAGLKLDVNMGNIEMSGAFRGVTDISANMGNVDLTPALPREQYSVKIHETMNNRTLGSDNAPNRMEIDVDMGGVEVNFDN